MKFMNQNQILQTSKYWYISVDGVAKHAHQWVYMWENNLTEIPKGHNVHHTCENKACLNGDHLVLMTSRDHRALHNRQRDPRIAQIHPEHGLLKIWDTMQDAQRAGFSQGNIGKVCNGQRDTASGCWWMRIK